MKQDQKIIKFINRRVFIILTAKFSLFVVLIYRLFYLQIIKHNQYLNLAKNNHSRTIVEPVQRGLILDCNNKILADNISEYMLIIDIKQITTINDFFDKTNDLLHLTEIQKNKIMDSINKRKRFIELKFVSFEEFLWIQYYLGHLPEILISKRHLRIYPYKEITAHIIGYVINESKIYNNNYYIYNNNFKSGKIGIESKFNIKLSGTNRVIKIEVDAHGNKIQELGTSGGQIGENIKSSINVDLQELIWGEIKNVGANIAVIDIQNQQLVALSSSPSYDPEIFNNDELRKANWSNLSNDESRPLINKAISGLYSPGSTYKIIVALAALELGIINEHTSIFCNGGHQVGNRFYHCLHYHGSMNVKQAIEKSCNSFFYALAHKINIEFLEKLSLSFGMGKISNLNLEGELKGIIPSKSWKLKRFADSWRIGDSANLMIGQGYLSCNALQLTTAIASIASGNIINLSLLKNQTPQIENNKLISLKNLDIVRKAMFSVINSPHSGTGYNSIGSKYQNLQICGKTGTVQISSGQKHKNHSLFVGYAPYDNPKYAVSVIGEFMGYGSKFAAPIAGKIFNFLK